MYFVTGAPLVLTYPHFLYADPIYRDNILGMAPIEEEHRIYIDIEPVSFCICFLAVILRN